jgi:hypothetical protein
MCLGYSWLFFLTVARDLYKKIIMLPEQQYTNLIKSARLEAGLFEKLG